MIIGRDKLASDLHNIVSNSRTRIASVREVAELIRNAGSYRWVGLYDVNIAAGTVTNIAWSGPSAPEYPTFPITKGLTSAAISGKRTVNVGNVAADPRYLTAFSNTRSEIIVPVFDPNDNVVGTIDIESEKSNAFSDEDQAVLEACADAIRPLW
jgi:L-methionine (R)-S-oxide reductase